MMKVLNAMGRGSIYIMCIRWNLSCIGSRRGIQMGPFIPAKLT